MVAVVQFVQKHKQHGNAARHYHCLEDVGTVCVAHYVSCVDKHRRTEKREVTRGGI